MATKRPFSREDWIIAARKVLVHSGVDDVKVDRLAVKMKVTRGSFYWHFKSRKDLLDALLQDWELRNRVEIAQIEDRWKLSEPTLNEFFEIWLDEDPNFPSFDMAIRVWARKTPAVMAIVRRMDDSWIQLMMSLFLRSGMAEDEALVRARVLHYHQIGYYALGLKEDIASRIKLSPIYYRVLTGSEPTAEQDKVFDRFRDTAAQKAVMRTKNTKPVAELDAQPKPAPIKTSRSSAKARINGDEPAEMEPELAKPQKKFARS